MVRVEPRSSILTRRYRRRVQVIAANVEQVLIVTSVAQPDLKPNLIDRYLITAEQSGIVPVICVNKVDMLGDQSLLDPIIKLYRELGYAVVPTSALSGEGVGTLREALAERETVVVGQSGVGKSSLLNALEPRFQLRIGPVSQSTQKGRHTTVVAQLLGLAGGGHVIDTPGIRQFELWDCDRDTLAAAFVEFRPYAAHCRFSGCTHSHEADCAVKRAVDENGISPQRYESYCRILASCTA